MKRYKSIFFCAALLFAGFAPQANAEEITPRFSITVDPDKYEVHSFEVSHGETVLFEVTFKRPSNETMTFFWQEQGMGDSYWSERCTTVGDGVYRAVFTPQMDSGAKVFNCFIGRPGMIYRAVFQLRMKQSPGATPSELSLPVKTLDFEKITVENAPYYTKEQTESVVGSIIGDTVTKEYVENLGITGGSGGEVAGVKTINNLDGDIKIGFVPGYTKVKFTSESTEGEKIGTIETRTLSSHLNIDNEGANIEQRFESRIDYDVILPNKIMQPIKNATAAAYLSSQDALAYASGVFNFMNANTNAWFAGTNYVVGASATTRHKFTFEAGMDLSTVPCSMSLWERRDGKKSAVWDQRDWVSWYWSFKASQMQERINATNEALRAEIAAKAPAAWAKRTAATGLVNPDETTTWIDTKTVTLSPGMAWETVATVDGCGYWTIVGNGATIGGSDKSPLLSIKDFEGNEVLKIKKTASYMAYLNSADFVAGGMRDADGRICFDVRSDVQPVGEFSTTLVNEDFVAEDSDGCPALYEWEDIGGGKYRIHFILKPGIVSDACFARFKVEVQGETTVEYSCGQTISGGLIYNGVKIAPVVTQGAAIGTTVTWKVVR